MVTGKNTMHCNDVQGLLVDYIEGELDTTAVDMVEQHLETCTHCQEIYQDFKESRSFMQPVEPPEPGDQFWESFPQQVLESYKATSGSTTPIKKTPFHTISKFARRLTNPSMPQLAFQAVTAILIIGTIILFAVKPDNVVFNSASLQTRIQTAQPLSKLLPSIEDIDKAQNHFAFAPSNRSINFFNLGRQYAETLALVASNERQGSLRHLRVLNEFFDDSASAEITETLTSIENEIAINIGQEHVDMIGRLQPEIETYASDEDSLVLFRLGSWLTDLHLITSANDKQLKEQEIAAKYFIKELPAINVPRGTIESMKALQQLLPKAGSSQSDRQEILQTIKRIQSIHG